MSDDIQKKSNKLVQDEELSDADFLSIAQDRFKIAMEAEAMSREEEADDLKFMVGDQWPQNVKAERLRDARPCLTVNQIPQFVRQITNDQRQNRPSIKVSPVDDAADVDTAKVLEGMIRHIEYASCADIAIDTAFECAARSGIGYFGLTTDYADSTSFQQEIKFRQFKDRMAVYTDPYWQSPDGSDIQWAFVVSDPSRDEFEAEYPDAEITGDVNWESYGNTLPDWFSKNSCRVAEYFYKTFEEVDLCLLSDGTEMEKDDIEELPDFKDWEDGKMGLPEGVRVVSEREGIKTKIKWAKINGKEILDRTDLHGEWIPIIPVIGEENMVDGKRIFSGIVRQMKDPQRMYNYFASAETEAIALAPKAPFIAAVGQIEGFEDQWQQANTKNIPVLMYKPKSVDGVPCPPPQRNVTEPAVQAITQAMQLRSQEMKATTGQYDPMLGKQTNSDMSGVAIQRRISQSGTATFHYGDNLSRSQRHAGRITLAWIPKVYNAKMAARIIGEDGEVDFAKINQIFDDGGESSSHMLDHGRYDCTCSTGPSYQTKREEAVAAMLDLTRSVPDAMKFALDILVRNMDWPGNTDVADRLKKMLPPQLTADDKNAPPIPPQIQQQMAHMGQMVQELTKQNQEYMEAIRSKQIETASKERIAMADNRNELLIEWMKHHQADSLAMFQADMDHIDRKIGLAKDQNSDAGSDVGQSQDMPTGGASPGQPMEGNP